MGDSVVDSDFASVAVVIIAIHRVACGDGVDENRIVLEVLAITATGLETVAVTRAKTDLLLLYSGTVTPLLPTKSSLYGRATP